MSFFPRQLFLSVVLPRQLFRGPAVQLEINLLQGQLGPLDCLVVGHGPARGITLLKQSQTIVNQDNGTARNTFACHPQSY